MGFCSVFGCANSNQKKNKDENKIKLFSFPQKDQQIRKKWILACCRKDVFVPDRICSIHFKADDYQRNLKHELLNYCPKNSRLLKEEAIPSLNLPTMDQYYKQNADMKINRIKQATRRQNKRTVDAILTDEKSKELHDKKRHVAFRVSDKVGTNLSFQPPKLDTSKEGFRTKVDLLNQDNESCKQWTHLCQRSDLDDVYKKGYHYMHNYRICSVHFNPSCFMNSDNTSAGLIKGSVPTINLPSSTTQVSKNGSGPKKRLRSQTPSNEPDLLETSQLLDQLSGVEPGILQTTVENVPPLNECCSTPCKHYIELIEEKARCHKLMRNNEELQERVNLTEALIQRVHLLEAVLSKNGLSVDDLAIKIEDETSL